MALSISRKEVEDIKPYLEKTVSKFLGFREPSLVTTLMHCLSSGYDKYKTAGKYFIPLYFVYLIKIINFVLICRQTSLVALRSG